MLNRHVNLFSAKIPPPAMAKTQGIALVFLRPMHLRAWPNQADIAPPNSGHTARFRLHYMPLKPSLIHGSLSL
jgi:hypothetical protein